MVSRYCWICLMLTTVSTSFLGALRLLWCCCCVMLLMHARVWELVALVPAKGLEVLLTLL